MYAGLERLPDSLLEASADLGASDLSTMRRVVLPLVFPGGRRRVDLHVLADPRRLHRGADRRRQTNQMLGNVVYDNLLTGNNLPFAAAVSTIPLSAIMLLPGRGAADRCTGEPLTLSPGAPLRGRHWPCWCWLFVYAPLRWWCSTRSTRRAPSPGRRRVTPPQWWVAAWHSAGRPDAVWVSVEVGLAATAIALVLGTMAALALQRYRFFGRDTVSLLMILPIALPGMVTGIALNATFLTARDPLGLATVIIGHATFCIVIVFNNAIARLRRLGANLEDASADLGAARGRRSGS